MPSAHANRYTPESRQRAVQLYESRSPVTYAEVARELGVDAGTLSKWVAQASPAEDVNVKHYFLVVDFYFIEYTRRWGSSWGATSGAAGRRTSG